MAGNRFEFGDIEVGLSVCLLQAVNSSRCRVHLEGPETVSALGWGRGGLKRKREGDRICRSLVRMESYSRFCCCCCCC